MERRSEIIGHYWKWCHVERDLRSGTTFPALEDHVTDALYDTIAVVTILHEHVAVMHGGSFVVALS